MLLFQFSIDFETYGFQSPPPPQKKKKCLQFLMDFHNG